MAQRLVSCSACGGLSPALAVACLHCDRVLPRRRRVGGLARLLAGGGFLMTLAACYGVAYRSQYPGEPDDDGDGAPLPADCDDHDASRFPGAQDPDGDGVDQNCDGVDGWREPAVMADPQSGPAPTPAPAAPAPTPP